MVDPISIFGATASVIGVIDVLSRSINLLENLRSQWKTADLALLSLTSQLVALNAALVKIHEWTESGVDELHHQLVMDLKTSVDCCRILASKVHDEISDLQKSPGGTLLTTTKAKFTLKRSGLSELQSMVDRQTSTLTLLLTACNSKSLAKQHEILVDSSVRKRLDTVQKDTASLTGLVDSSSFRSKGTENSSKLSVQFDFDEELLSTKPYKAFIRKTFKYSVRFQKRISLPGPSQVSGDVSGNAEPVFQISNPVSDVYAQDLQESQYCAKILLLGTGESSKTTFLKQMQSFYSYKDLMDDGLGWRNIIYDNLRTAFRMLLSVYADDTEGSMNSATDVLPMAMSMQRIIDSGPHDFLPPKFAESLKLLLDATAHKTSLPKDLEEILENLDYFVKHLTRVCAHSYRPSNEDILHTRVRTTGVYKYVFPVDRKEYIVYDVGGERSERKKWGRIIEGSPVVTIFVSMSCYDLVLYEDNTTNRMEEALILFGSIVNADYFAQSKLLLCFTKMDVFERKISAGKSPIRDFFPEYDGSPTDVAGAKRFFTGKFTSLVQCPRELSIYYIDAMNTYDVRTVLANIFDDAPPSPPHLTFSKHAESTTTAGD